MAIVYAGFNMHAEELLDSRQIISSSDQLPTIEHPCEGLLVWSKSENTFFVYKEEDDMWMQMPVTIPIDVINPINGSVKYDPETLKLYIYYGGSWYSTQTTLEPDM